MTQAATAEKPPIFVTGNPRSGTTLMRVLLSAHPNIYITHEPWFYIWNSLAPKKMTGDEFLKYYFHTFSFRFLRLRPPNILRELPSPLPREDVHLAFREIMRQKAVAAGRIRYGEKTPGHTDHLGAIYRDFPDAKVVVMVRDPRSCVDSTRKMVWGSQGDLGNCIAYELARRNVQKFSDRLLYVKLEDLRLEPEKEMRRILEFVDEPWDPAVLDHAKNNPLPNDMPPVPWLQTASQPLVSTELRLPTMEPNRVRLIETVCRASMKQFGYERMQFENPPGVFRVATRIASEAPEAARYLWKVYRLFDRLRDPRKWAGRVIYVKMYRELNPRWWLDNKDLLVPGAPSLHDESAPSESRRVA